VALLHVPSGVESVKKAQCSKQIYAPAGPVPGSTAALIVQLPGSPVLLIIICMGVNNFSLIALQRPRIAVIRKPGLMRLVDLLQPLPKERTL
jgi:hypothetical protein